MVGSCGNLKASAIEIYNNSPFDLLNERKPLQLSRSKNAGSMSVRVTSKRGPDIGAGFTSNKVGLNGEHPQSCTCHDCFKAKELEKEARKLRIAKIRGEKLPPPKKSRAARARKEGVSSRTVSAVETAARTVGETLWDLRTPNDVARFSRQIELSRVAHGHALNARSSRSHCLVRLQAASSSGGDKLLRQCFTFVDLAGSERTGKSGVKGQRMSEAIGINNSLTVLGRCIRGVGRGTRHIPWRDAVLCQLLRTSFEDKGATHTAVVVNVSPEHEDETLCTLRFGENVACVSNQATVVTGQNVRAEMDALRSEVNYLRKKKREMEKAGQGSGFVEGCVNTERISLQANMDKLEAIRARIADLKVKIVEVGHNPAKARDVKRTLAAVQKEEDVAVGIVLRQQTIKTLWQS